MMAPEIAVVLVVLGIAIGIHIGKLWTGRQVNRLEKAAIEAEATVELITMERDRANRLLNRYAPDRDREPPARIPH